jgi:opacity protein-like surface antigen
MKKIYPVLLLTILLVLSVSATAQVKFGVKGAVDVADHKISTSILNAKNRLGFQVGPTVDLMIPLTGFGVDLSLLYGYKKYSIDEKAGDPSISNYSYLMVPLNLKKRFSIIVAGMYVYAGPYAAIRLSGGDLEAYGEEFKAKNFEAGLNAGLGVSLFSKVDVGLNYKCKLTDNYSIDNPDFGNIGDKTFQTWSVGLTYFF